MLKKFKLFMSRGIQKDIVLNTDNIVSIEDVPEEQQYEGVVTEAHTKVKCVDGSEYKIVGTVDDLMYSVEGVV